MRTVRLLGACSLPEIQGGRVTEGVQGIDQVAVYTREKLILGQTPRLKEIELDERVRVGDVGWGI